MAGGTLYPGTIPEALKVIGRELDEYDATGALDLYAGSTVSNVHPARVVDCLCNTQRRLFSRFIREGAERTNLAKKVTLSQASDTQDYVLPPRVVEVYRVRDSDMSDITDTTMLWPLRDMLTQARGVRVQQNGTRVRFVDFQPDTSLTYSAWVLQVPARLTYGAVGASTTTTTITLASSPTYGETMLRDDQYNGETICPTGGTSSGVGTYQEITDYAGSTRVCTVGTAWTLDTNDTYSLVMSLPEAAWDCLYIMTAARLGAVWRGIDEEARAALRAAAEDSYASTIEFLREPQPMADLRPHVPIDVLH